MPKCSGFAGREKLQLYKREMEQLKAAESLLRSLDRMAPAGMVDVREKSALAATYINCVLTAIENAEAEAKAERGNGEAAGTRDLPGQKGLSAEFGLPDPKVVGMNEAASRREPVPASA